MFFYFFPGMGSEAFMGAPDSIPLPSIPAEQEPPQLPAPQTCLSSVCQRKK